jgi:hypothetical protein
MSLRYSLLLGVVLLLVSTATLVAQQSLTSPFGNDQLWEFGVWGGEAFGKQEGQAFGETQLTMAGFRAGRVIHESTLDSGMRRSLEYVIELDPAFFVRRTHPAYGGGFSPIGLKFNFAPRRNGRYRPYLEMNGGAMFTQFHRRVWSRRDDRVEQDAGAQPGTALLASLQCQLGLQQSVIQHDSIRGGI